LAGKGGGFESRGPLRNKARVSDKDNSSGRRKDILKFFKGIKGDGSKITTFCERRGPFAGEIMGEGGGSHLEQFLENNEVKKALAMKKGLMTKKAKTSSVELNHEEEVDNLTHFSRCLTEKIQWLKREKGNYKNNRKKNRRKVKDGKLP